MTHVESGINPAGPEAMIPDIYKQNQHDEDEQNESKTEEIQRQETVNKYEWNTRYKNILDLNDKDQRQKAYLSSNIVEHVRVKLFVNA